MRNPKKLQVVLAVALCCVLAASVVIAAEDRPAPRGGNQQEPGQGGQRGGRGGFDREAMQTRMLEMMKERLGASDEEWKVIQPRLSEVMMLAQSARGGGVRGMVGGRGNRGNRGQNQQATEPSTDPVEIASQALQETLDKEAPSSTEIQNKLLALRGAREQAKQKLVAAQQKLREVLSVKQEAQLVVMGMLD